MSLCLPSSSSPSFYVEGFLGTGGGGVEGWGELEKKKDLRENIWFEIIIWVKTGVEKNHSFSNNPMQCMYFSSLSSPIITLVDPTLTLHTFLWTHGEKKDFLIVYVTLFLHPPKKRIPLLQISPIIYSFSTYYSR